MGVHKPGAWLCCAVLVVWCATEAVCSPVAQKPAPPRKRVTYPRVVIEPTTAEAPAYDVADRAPFDSSKIEGTADEATTPPVEDTLSPLLASLDDDVLGSMNTTNSTFNDTSESDNNFDEENFIFACNDTFARARIRPRKEDCEIFGITWNDDPENEGQTGEVYDDYLDEQGEEFFIDYGEEETDE